MDIETSLNKLFSLHTFGIKLGLDNTIGFLNHLGNPQQELKTIHIAGSNGKGSTASFIASILQEFGLKVGLYTSPHFVKFNERVVINGKQIENEYISSFITDNENYINEHQLTFFEVTTAITFQYFREMKPDYCIIETGLGGRLDATNVLNPLAVVITTISLEHTNILGNTIEQIAAEKAAIIKKGFNVFTGFLEKEAMDVVEKKCKETKSNIYPLKDFVSEIDEQVSLILEEGKQIEINPTLKGKYQKYNAALATLTISKTFSFKDERKYLSGISKVLTNTGLQGRYEYYHKNPTIIFDSAHNPESIKSFLSEFAKETVSYKKRILIFGAMRDKDISDMLQILSSYFSEIFVTEIQYERAAKPRDIKSLGEQINITCNIIQEPVKYIEEFRLRNKNECLVVLGSMYLLGEIKQQLLQGVT
ncbi:MAG: bifunctional folylpolyglutamate synthase/dihydrofolate synthase [Ignavibacteria bacterium]|nr:bifunctional folylpolyglutamate synthase/dihydrofolate synthase [Ignavibacteria bacterium]